MSTSRFLHRLLSVRQVAANPTPELCGCCDGHSWVVCHSTTLFCFSARTSVVGLCPVATEFSFRRFEARLGESLFVLAEVDFALEHLASWMKPTDVPTPLVNKPARSRILYDPKGVVLVRRGAWRDV